MAKWFDRASIFLLVVFGLLYVGAKIHFFTHYGLLSPGTYLKEHWPFWAGMVIVVVVANCVDWIRKRIKGPNSN